MIYLTNRDGGLTDEEGHYKYLAAAFTGNVISGMSVGQNSPLGMSVVVSGGDARVPYGNYAYSVWIPSGSPETATIPTADGSNPRIDRIVLYVDRSEDTQQVTPNNPGIAKIAVVAGTPGAVPVRPNDAAVNSAVSNNPWINLADVAVGTGVTQITNANITDTRSMASAITNNLTVPSGGTVSLPPGSLETADYGDGSVTPSKLGTGASSATVATSQGLSGTSFTDLDTVGPSVTVNIGANGLALVTLYAQMTQSAANGSCIMGFAVSGASTVAASDNFAVRFQAYANGAIGWSSLTFLVTGLTAGSNTFTSKYRAQTTGTATFANRRIAVVPL